MYKYPNFKFLNNHYKTKIYLRTWNLDKSQWLLEILKTSRERLLGRLQHLDYSVDRPLCWQKKVAANTRFT